MGSMGWPGAMHRVVVLGLTVGFLVLGFLFGLAVPRSEAQGASEGSRFMPITPERLLDTRAGLQVGEYDSAWNPGQTRTLKVAGVGPVPAGAVAVAVHVTTVNPTADLSWLNIFPTSTTPATTAVHNFGTAGFTTQLVNDLIIAKVGSNGSIDIFNAHGQVDLIIDITGYYVMDDGSGFVPVTPERLLDTRAGLQVGEYDSPWNPSQTRTLKVAGVGPVPAGAVAVAVHVTTVNPTADLSWLNIYPTSTAPATTAVHNFGTAGFTSQVANDLIIAKVGTNGSIDIFNAHGQVDVIIDIVGYYAVSGGSAYTSLAPERLLDTRVGFQVGEYDSPWNPSQTRTLQVTGVGQVPAEAVAVALHVTSVNPTADLSWLNIFPTSATPATTAVHNFGTAAYTTEVVNDLIMAKVGTNGSIDIFNANGQVDLIVDIVGYYSPSSCVINALTVSTVASQPECDALLALYDTTGGANWTLQSGWNTPTDPCTWHGVTCGGSHISAISLSFNNLVGQLPAEIGQLTNLRVLELRSNQLTALPPEIGQLINLTQLELATNLLTALPPEIGQLTNLTEFHPMFNQLAALPPEIGQLTNLTSMLMTGNQLTSLPPEIGQLTGLSLLGLGNNQLSSLPPEIGQLTNLSLLDLSANQLTSLPPEIGQLTRLFALVAGFNQLETLPAEIGQLTNLTVLFVHNSQLVAIPPEIGQLTNLTQLALQNNQLSGDITAPMSALRTSGALVLFLRLEGQVGCVTVTDPLTENWLAGLDATWNDGCA